MQETVKNVDSIKEDLKKAEEENKSLVDDIKTKRGELFTH